MKKELKDIKPVILYKEMQEDGKNKIKVYEGDPDKYIEFLQNLNKNLNN